MYKRLKQLVFPILKIEETEPEALPGHEGEVYQVIRACPSYLQYRLLFWKLYAGVWFIAVASLSIFLAFQGWFWLLMIPLIILAIVKVTILYVTTRVDYEMRWYVITERSLLIRQGVWVGREICLTYMNAQNVRVKQGPLQRYFGFSNVEVDTAGGGRVKKEDEMGSSHRAVLRGLQNPVEIRDLILKLLKRSRTAGLGDMEDRPVVSTERLVMDSRLFNEIRDETRALRELIEQKNKT